MANQSPTAIAQMQQCYEAANAAHDLAQARAEQLTPPKKDEFGELSRAERAVVRASDRSDALSASICVEPPLTIRDTLVSLAHIASQIDMIQGEVEASACPIAGAAISRAMIGLSFAVARLSLECDESLSGWSAQVVRYAREHLEDALAAPEIKEAA
jgi:acetaldehyde dehydrogenase (acetylating)